MIQACTGWNIKDWYMLIDTLTASMILQRLKNEKIIGSLNFHLELFSFSEAKKCLIILYHPQSTFNIIPLSP